MNKIIKRKELVCKVNEESGKDYFEINQKLK